MRPMTHAFRAPPAPRRRRASCSSPSATWARRAAGRRRPASIALIALAEPAFVLGARRSDATPTCATQAAVDRHFDDVMVWSRRAAYMPVWGNHEWGDPQRDDLRNYKGRFALPHAAASPGAPAAGCCGEDWYWFDYGDGPLHHLPRALHRTRPGSTGPQQAEPLFAEARGRPAHHVRRHRRATGRPTRRATTAAIRSCARSSTASASASRSTCST